MRAGGCGGRACSGEVARAAFAGLAAGDRDPVGAGEAEEDLASGRLDLAGIVADPPEWVMSARVRDLLLALPRICPVKAGRILAQCGIARSQPLGGLTDRQRAELIDFFRV